MRLVTMRETARRLGVDPDKIRRNLQRLKNGQELLQLDDLRLTVYRRGVLGNRYFDAVEIAHQMLRRNRRQRLSGE